MSRIGQVVYSKVSVLGNPVGTKGYVFNEYSDFDDPSKTGVQVIFANGEYDGFSAEEQELFLILGEIEWRYTDYQFRSVMQVSEDFRNGRWKF